MEGQDLEKISITTEGRLSIAFQNGIESLTEDEKESMIETSSVNIICLTSSENFGK